MQNFISRSHERQRLVALRAEERYIEDLHNAQRDKLFAVKRKIEANVNAHPICGMSYTMMICSFVVICKCLNMACFITMKLLFPL